MCGTDWWASDAVSEPIVVRSAFISVILSMDNEMRN